MKKSLLSLFLIALGATLLGLFPASAQVVESVPAGEDGCGDIDEDGFITSDDAELVLEFTTQIDSWEDDATAYRCDVNSTKIVSVEDALLILQVSSGSEAELECDFSEPVPTLGNDGLPSASLSGKNCALSTTQGTTPVSLALFMLAGIALVVRQRQRA